MSQGSVRFKNKSTDILFDVMLYGVTEDGEFVVLTKQVASSPPLLQMLTLDKFCENFEEYYGPQGE